MIVRTFFLIDMFCVLVLCPALLVAGVQTLTIDSQLGTSIEDCFERITIGEQLPPTAIFRNVSELTTRECEQICKQDKQCQSYDYGVGDKGNATCNLSKFGDKELKDTKLMRHPDYDVYLRRLNCEQAPPIPLAPLPQADESQGPSQDGPAHRPIFRPVDEEPKRPEDHHSLADDFHTPNDMRPHETVYRPLRPQFYNNYYDVPYNRPSRPYSSGYRPHYTVNNHIDERPDDYGSQKPENDQNLGYGSHKPQDVPFQPERPQRPNDQNLSSNRPKPDDPYDVLNFQDPYVRPPVNDPGLWRPDPYFPPSPEDEVHDIYGPKPIRPNHYPDRPIGPVLDEKPNYHYIVRPNRKPTYQNPPRPQEDFGYAPINPYQHHQKPEPGYGQNDPIPIGPSSPPYRPEKPHDDFYDQYPSRPYEKPTYSYNSQYASSYGQSSHYNQGNDVHVEIYDPPRPYRPPKPTNKPLIDKPISGYGQNTNDFAGYNRPTSQNSGYGGYDTHTSQNYHSQSQNSPSQYGSLQNSQSNGYGQQDSHNEFPTQGGYNRPPQDPIDHRPPKPSYVSQSTQYGQTSQYYGSQSQGNQYGSQSYGSTSQIPQEPYHKPQSNQGYGSQDNQGGYGSQSSYGSNNLGAYGTQTSSYNSNQASYGGATQQHSTSHSSYGSTQNAHGSSHNTGYGSQNHDGNYDRPDQPYNSEVSLPEDEGYKNSGNVKPGSTTKRPVYGSPKPESDKKRPVYAYERPETDKYRPGYGNERPDYDKHRPAYGNDRPETDKNRPGYGNERPETDKNRPGYGNERPESDKNRPGYGNERPETDKNRPGYGNERPESDKNRPGYGNERPETDKNRPGYGNERPETDKNRPVYGQNPISSTSGNDKPYRPDVRPVYEYDLDRPNGVPSYIVRPDGQVITSKPVAISDVMGRRPGVSRDPGNEFSYKACFRRVLAGKRALRSHVRRVAPCDRLEDCRRECATERRFHCESFNYKLDPSFRGKGLCELMTKPIEAFDIHRDFVEDKDFDFFELDRNSLEPYCPESLRGPGHLHSGYLSSKPDNLISGDQKWDRYDRNRGVHGDADRRYDDRRPGYGGGNRRRPDDQFFIPYQIGMARSSEDESWGQYGGSYGGNNYYKDRNDHRNSLDHWQLTPPKYNRPEPPYGVRPHASYEPHGFDYTNLGSRRPTESTHHYNYGNEHWKRGHWNSTERTHGLSYGESNYYRPTKPSYPVDRSDVPVVKDCTSRRRPGMSLSSGAIRRSLQARNVVECEAACFSEREFKCVSYSYRYSHAHGTDNCFLSERPYRGLDMASDSGSDVYAMPQDHGCTVTQKPWVESECFWHVRSESAVSGSVIKSALTVAGLGACEAECIRAHGFFCRGFSFRFDSPTIGDELENCLLTSSPPTSLVPNNGLRKTQGHELYARGNYGRGCEPALYDELHHKEKQCYLQYDNAAKLIGAAIKGHAHAKDEEACGQSCTNAPFRCLSYSYNQIAPPDQDNCLLSEIRLFDLQRGVDYEHSDDDWLFAFDLFNGECWRKVHGKSGFDDPTQELPRPLSPPSTDVSSPSGPPSGNGYIPSGPESRPPSGYIPEARPSYVPESGPSRPTGPSYLPETRPPSYRPDYPTGPSYKPDFIPGPPEHYKPDYPPPEPYKPSYRPDPPYIPAQPTGPGYKPYLPEEPSGPGYKPGYISPPGYKPGFPPPIPSGPSYRPDPEPSYGLPEPSGPGYRPGYRPTGPPGPSYAPGGPPGPSYAPGGPPGPSYGPIGPPSGPPSGPPGYGPDRGDEESMMVSWRHYTVSGFPCRQGTTCAQNQVGGHWACEPEGGEIGSWDYCCAPTHRCGYSEGFHKPWCYVGPSVEQWRPCSEKYYPYHQHNVPHPSSQGHREDRPRPSGPPGYGPPPIPPPGYSRPRPGSYLPDADRKPVHIPGPYLPEADRRYWDNLYMNGPQAYYDKHGNPLPGYTRVPTASRPHIKYQHNYGPMPGGAGWEPIAALDSGEGLDPPVPGGLGAPRYWPVAYLHRGPPPNVTYFRFNETDQSATTTERYDNRSPIIPPREKPLQDFNRKEKDKNGDKVEGRNREENNRSLSEKEFKINVSEVKTTTTTPKIEIKEEKKLEENEKNKTILVNTSNVDVKATTMKAEKVKVEAKEDDDLKGIDDKLDDFSGSIEVLDIEDAKTGDKISDIKTLEAEERQIEAIGRLLASRRGGKLILEKRSQKDLEAKSIAIDKELPEDFNFGNRFPTTERKGIIQKVTKDEIERERNIDKSLEVSETATFVRPPRVLSTTENIRKALVNGKIFYDATIREQRDLFSNTSRKHTKTFRPLEDIKAPSVLANQTYGKKKTIRPRNVNPVRRVRRIYRKRYNPDEVRRRLLEREKSLKQDLDAVGIKKS